MTSARADGAPECAEENRPLGTAARHGHREAADALQARLKKEQKLDGIVMSHP